MAYQNDRIKQIPAPLPKDYDRQTNFTDYETINPGKPVRGADLDAEFNVIEQAMDETQARQRLIQRDDGALQNGIVDRDALSPEVIAGVKSPTTWTTGTVYAESDSVIVYDQPGQTDPAWYAAEQGHTATDFASDLAAGRWRLLVDLSTLLVDAGKTQVTTGSGTQDLDDSLNQRPIVFQTEADMVAEPNLTVLTPPITAITLGKTSAGDGEGQTFKIVASGGDVTLDNGNEAQIVSKVKSATATQTAGAALDDRVVNVLTVAALRTIEPTRNKQQINLVGHTTPGRGGGEFYYDDTDTSTVDDDGTVIVTSGGARWKRKMKSAVYTDYFNITGAAGDLSKVEAARDAAVANGLRLVFSGREHVFDGDLQFDVDDLKVSFLPKSFITHTADTVCIRLGGSATRRKNLQLRYPRIETAGFGQDSAGLIQVNNVEDWEIRNPHIDSDRAAANTREKIYNGIATADVDRGLIHKGRITGTAKSCIHVSTASRDVTCYRVSGDDTGVHDTASFGFAPCFDSGGYGGNHYIECTATNPQGEFFLIKSEDNATFGANLASGNSVVRCYGKNSGRSAVSVGRVTGSLLPDNIKIYKNYFEVIGLQGIEVDAGTVHSKGNTLKDIQRSGLSASSDEVDVYLYSNSDTIINWDLADNVNFNGFNIGTVQIAKIVEPIFRHDFSGVTVANVRGIGTTTGKVVSKFYVLDPDFGELSGSEFFRYQVTPAAGHVRYQGSGSPSSGAAAINGSIYNRDDGSSTNDNLYIVQAGAWANIA